MTTLTLGQLLQQAVQAFALGDDLRARQACEAVLAARPQTFEAVYVLGMIEQRAGDLRRAVDHLQQAMRLDPSRPEAPFALGTLLEAETRNYEALACYEQAITLRPDFSHAHFNRASLLAAIGQLEAAVKGYRRAISCAPQDETAHFNLGVLLIQVKRPAQALASFELAVALKPAYARAWAGRGMALWGLGRLSEALASLDEAIRLEPNEADHWSHRATVLLDMDRPDEALDSSNRSLMLAPEAAETRYTRGNALRALNRFDEAIDSFERVLSLDPMHRDAHINLADCLLLLGRFERGWTEYAWRWHPSARPVVNPPAVGRPWSGDPRELQGRRILLYSELGLGDTLQFCRYTAALAAQGARPILAVQAPLVPLLQQLAGVEQVTTHGEIVFPIELYCPLMRLPQLLAVVPTAESAGSPYLTAPAEYVASLRARLGPAVRPRVGVVWRGSGALLNDQRSMALAEWLPLLQRFPEVDWFSLQKDQHPLDSALASQRTDLRWLQELTADWLGTATLVEAMDLVISVDTSVAHLAGAMGKPVWIMLPHTPQDWRWFTDRDDSPWYPGARLFRQRARGQWSDVIYRLSDALYQRFPQAHY